jgi:hypothetical protein
MTYYNPWNKRKFSNFNDNLDPNLFLLIESDMSFLMLAKYSLQISFVDAIIKMAEFDTMSKSAITDLNQFLDDAFLEASGSCVSFPKFGVNIN